MGDDAERPRQCALGARATESGAARLEGVVTAYRDALKEWTRDRVPLQWAMAQNKSRQPAVAAKARNHEPKLEFLKT